MFHCDSYNTTSLALDLCCTGVTDDWKTKTKTFSVKIEWKVNPNKTTSIKKNHLKMSCVKWWLFHSGLDVSKPRGGTRSKKWWGCAARSWKLDPKRLREKWNLGPKRSNSARICRFSTSKDRFGVDGWEKVPLKDRVRSPESQKRGSKQWHIHITQHRGSTLPGVKTLDI